MLCRKRSPIPRPHSKSTPHPLHLLIDRYLFRVVLISILLIGFFPLPVNANIDLETYRSAEAPTVISGEFQLETLAFAPEVKPVIEKVESSAYLEAEKARLAAEAAQRATAARKASQRTNLTVNYAPPASYDPCSCVSYARWRSGIHTGSIGLAKYHPINSSTPSIGAIIITRDSWAGHVGVVTGIADGKVTFAEANYIRCRVGSRTLPLNATVIRGYYR